VCLAAVSLAVPALVAGSSDGPGSKKVTHVAAGAPHRQVAASPHRAPTTPAPTTTVASTATAAVAVSVPSTTEAPSTRVDAVAWHSPTTTTTVPATAPPSTAPPTTPPPTAAAPAAVRPAHSESGVASYYDDPNGGCAHKTLAFGTVVHITASNGRTATCVVDDRGPFGDGRILDLDTSIFAQLAPLSAGLVSVTATW
jgi:rare lipoprotein A (peptidoglycan hydrolase)